MPRPLRATLALALALAAPACKGEAAKPAPPPASTQPAAAEQATREALAAYERVRAALAADTTTGVPEAAADVEKAATSAAAAATGDAKAQLGAAAAAARKLHDQTDLEAARLAFGELSRALVGVGAGDPALAAGRNVFMCPMAKGYQKWIQPSDKLENPYKGKAMLDCGAKDEWKP